MGGLGNIINLANSLFAFIKRNFLISIIIIIIFIIFNIKKDYSKSDQFLKQKTGMIVLDGKFGKGKTRFMSNLAKECEEKKMFVLGNFWNGYNFIQWSSLDDFLLLLKDLLILGEYQNFSDEDVKTMYGEHKEVLKEKMDTRKRMKRMYKHIPHTNYHCNFLVLGDEWQNYFYNRGAMSNFTGDKVDFLTLLHQVRHFNSLLIFGTQEASELDVKFRKLSSLYVNTFSKLNDLIFGYNVYSFTTDREFNLDVDKAIKYTKVPVGKINYYLINEFIGNINRNIERINKLGVLKPHKYNPIISIPKISKKFHNLRFYTKFNVNPKLNMYQEGDLFKKLNIFFKNDKNLYKFTDNV